MKAMIFAAGLGTRLRPLTDHTPKALVEVAGKSLLQHNLERLKHFGYTKIVINVHYLGHKIVEFLQHNNNFGLDIHISDESTLLLDTGGGLKKAFPYLKGETSFLLCNVDVISDLNLDHLRRQHEQSASLLTLAVKKRKSSRYLLFDREMKLSGWENEKTGEKIITQNTDNELIKYAFSGIQMVHPRIFDLIEEEGVFSTIPMYLRLSKSEKITGYTHNDGLWVDVGKIEKFEQAETIIQKINKE